LDSSAVKTVSRQQKSILLCAFALFLTVLALTPRIDTIRRMAAARKARRSFWGLTCDFWAEFEDFFWPSRKADFSTALLTKNVSSFGRNDEAGMTRLG
jgi:hypothetical protein